MNKYGIHISNKRHREFERLLRLGVSHFTGLHLNANELRRVRDTLPEAHILVRFYLPKWSEKDPMRWAWECADWVRANRSVTTHFTPANEMNLPFEGGGWTPEWYSRIDEWLLIWEREFRKLVPDAVLHWPALAQGHYEDGRHEDGYDLDWAGYEICRESIQRYDVMDVHPYWMQGGKGLWDGLGRWYAWRFLADRPRFFPDKDVFISECGNFAAQSPTALAEFLYFFEELYDHEWVVGATPFIWDSGPEHKDNIWVGNDCLIEGIAAYPKRDSMRPRYEDLVGELPTRGEYRDRQLTDIRRVVIHHTVAWAEDERQLVFNIARAHLRRGWPGIGYHYCVARDGTAYRTNPLWKVSFHAGPANPDSVGIAFLGNYDDREWFGNPALYPSKAQVQAVRNLIRGISEAVGRAVMVVGHRDVRATRCPGARLYSQLEDLRRG